MALLSWNPGKQQKNGQFTDAFTKSEHNQVPLLDRSAHLVLLSKELRIKQFVLIVFCLFVIFIYFPFWF